MIKISALFLLVMLAVACGGRPATGDGALDGGPPDLADLSSPPDSAKTLPWVSTYAGTTCASGNVGSGEGPLRQAVLQTTSDVVVEGPGMVLFATAYRVLRGVGATMKVVVGNTAGTHADGPVDKAGFGGIRAIAPGKDGAIYLVEDKTIRRIHQGYVTTLAGSDAEQPGYVDGPATKARFMYLTDIAVEQDGSLLVTDQRYLRRLRNGQVTTVAGATKPPKDYPHYRDGPALDVYLGRPYSLLVDGSDILFSTGGALLRKLAGGQVSTLYGAEEHPPIARDGPLSTARFLFIKSLKRHQGRGYFVNGNYGRVRSIENGRVKTLNMPAKTNTELSPMEGLRDGPLHQALFYGPSALAIDARGNLYVADSINCRIRYIELR